MDTIHSDIFSQNQPIDYIETALLKGNEFTVFLQLILNKPSSLNPQITQNLKTITRQFITAITKLKTAYIFGRYDSQKDFVNKINAIIRKTLSLNAYLFNTHIQIGSIHKNSIDANSLYAKILSSYKVFIHTVSKINENTITKPSGTDSTSVLIGTLRNSKQLTSALNNNYYHIPKILVGHPEDVKCVGLYQSRNLFGENSGIRYYGKVKYYTELPRYKIKHIPSESDEMYVIFEIKQWKALKKPIKADYLGTPCVFTDLYRFMKSERASELTLNFEEYRLYIFMKKLAFTKNSGCIPYKTGSTYYNGECFKIIKDSKTIYTITNERFYSNGVSAVKTITAMLD